MYQAESRPATPVAAADASYQTGTANYAGAPSVTGSSDGYYPSISPPVFVNQTPPAPSPQPVIDQAANQYSDGQYVRGQYAGGGRRVYHERHRRHGRSKKHSIEIVAGTAAAGAAIGAIAGGGPGAAIGAIAGGGAGFTYDRLTHNH
jgi:hypothetical protein